MDKEDVGREIDADIVNEVGNILSNNGANAFAKMIKDSIKINTQVQFISTENFNMEWIFTKDFSRIFDDVTHNYAEGYFLKTMEGVEGLSVLFFNSDHIKKLIEHVAQGMGLRGGTEIDAEQKQEILKEFISICLNAYLSALSNLIETRISATTPIPATDILGALYDFREHLKEANEEKALMIRTNIMTTETGITGKLIMLLEPTSLKKIISVLENKAGSN